MTSPEVLNFSFNVLLSHRSWEILAPYQLGQNLSLSASHRAQETSNVLLSQGMESGSILRHPLGTQSLGLLYPISQPRAFHSCV